MDITPIAAAVVAAGLAGVANWIGTHRASGKTEGVITTLIAELGARQERHEGETSKKFDAVHEEEKEQWTVIREHTGKISYLEGKVNGKSAHTH